jgi:MYXO-CTERM domain-containing protein
MRNHGVSLALVLASAAFLSIAPAASAADLTVGAVSSSLKVRKTDSPTTTPTVALKAAKNEFESFQIVMKAGATAVADVSAKVSKGFTGPGGATIPAANVVLYAERYYKVGTASNDEGAAGDWPDPLVPDVDTYFAEKRNAFPISVTAGETRVVWVDILVPKDQAAGDYAGEIEIHVAGAKQAAIPVTLHVGSFSLPSTATLASAFGMGWSTPAIAHCPGTSFPHCGSTDAANAIRALYLRSALEHRFTISDSDYQPPTSAGGDQTAYEKYVLPLVDGSSTAVRLPGAKLTSVRLDGNDSTVGAWITYARAKGFYDRLFYYPTDEPGTTPAAWASFITHSDALHAADATAKIIITSSIQDATGGGAVSKIDIFVPVIDQLENRPGTGAYAGDQRAKYDTWLSSKPSRKIWGYQSCDQHGCGSCGTKSPGVDYTGWPNRVIDSSGVQDRAFPWHAWRFKLSGELYFETTYQLTTAWDDNGQCAFSGSGDGTVFYPGTPAKIGGTKGIPIESIRMKMIREGMEDYEYLVMVAAKNPTLAKTVADGLFPHSYESAKTPKELEDARDRLFAALDGPIVPGDAGTDSGPGTDAGGDSAPGTDGGPGGDSGPGADASTGGDGSTDGGGDSSSGCGCRTAGESNAAYGGTALSLLAGLALFVRRRRADR